jgi:hypothetical protein
MEIYGNPRGRAARAPGIDFLAAKFTVSILEGNNSMNNRLRVIIHICHETHTYNLDNVGKNFSLVLLWSFDKNVVAKL